jgi:outer membrane receptor protein involved in Fe transport
LKPNLDDNFIYLENIYAAYLLVGEKFGDFSAQAGIRSEYSDISTELTKTNYTNPRDYINFFPSLNFGYNFNAFNSFQLSFAQRIERPRFRFLMPFSNFSDPRNFWQGNPDLDPEFTDSYEATYLYEYDKGSILTSLYSRMSTNIIQRVTRLDSTGFTTISPDNIGTRNSFGLEFNLDRKLTEWLEVNANANFFRAITDGDESVNNLDADTYTWNGRLSTQFNDIFGVDFQFNFNYEAPQEIPQGRLKQIWYLDLAASYDLSEDATLTLSGRDVFSTRMRRMVMQDETFYFDQDFQWRGGVITLNFNYRINSDKKDFKDDL